MLDVCLLGTGGMMPLPYRWLTSLLVRYNGSSLLIDCGEGTQIAIKEKGWSFKPIDVICFTHYHGDHISGLPGLLLTMGNADRTEPLTLIGPKGLERVVNSLRVIAPELPFQIKYIEITQPEQITLLAMATRWKSTAPGSSTWIVQMKRQFRRSSGAVCKKVKMSRTETIYTHRTWFLDLREKELN